MAETSLVETDVQASRALVAFLESHGFPLKAAMWIYHSDADRWRFVICPVEQRKDVTSFYRSMIKSVKDANLSLPLLGFERVDIVDENANLIKGLGGAIRVDGTNSVRFTNNRINGVFLEDALILKLAA